MSWIDLIRGQRTKKDADRKYSEFLNCTFSPEQMRFLVAESEENATTKTSIVRKCVNYYMHTIKKQQ